MTRFLKGLSLAGVAALVLTLGACDITNLNQNPNEPSQATTPNLLAGALQGDAASSADDEGLTDIYWDDYAGGFWIRYAQYWTTNQYTDADRYNFPTRRSGANNANFNDFYLVLNDLQEIIRINRRSPSEAAAFGPADNQIAIAKIVQAFTLHMMTDMWGPIPFAEALQGRDGGNFTPSYSSGEEVYTGIIDSLTAAQAMIDTDADTPTFPSADLVYGGDMSRWRKLANSLKMRVAMRMVDVNPGMAETAISEAVEAGVMESNADNASIPFSESPPYQNLFFENYEVDGRDDWAAPEPTLGLMNSVADPRRSAYYTDADPSLEGDQFNPFPYGLTEGAAQSLFTSAAFSRPGLAVRQAGSPAFIMFYDEVLFTQAEAAERGFIDGDPSSLYEDAIRASANYWSEFSAQSNITDDDIDAYLDRVPYDNNNDWAPVGAPGETWEHTLGIQKWLALYMQGIQGWSEWRRLDFQEVLQVPEGDPGTASFGCTFPLRMSYPLDEGTLNSDALEDAVTNLLGGDDDQGTPLWWDVDTPGCD